jgi:hypothetical protein
VRFVHCTMVHCLLVSVSHFPSNHPFGALLVRAGAPDCNANGCGVKREVVACAKARSHSRPAQPYESRSWYRDEPRNDDGRRSTWRPNFCTTCRERERSLQPIEWDPLLSQGTQLVVFSRRSIVVTPKRGGGGGGDGPVKTALHWNLKCDQRQPYLGTSTTKTS